ncbi:MAG: hypothetical protein IPK26_04745 [Planctomycetes bacterium]|nr:hypothetical protein [Planctomycetota bacterium]
MRLQAADQHTADRWARQLECLPFARVGRARRLANSTLELLARPGIAFGRRRLLARAPHAGEERVQVALPHLPSESPLSWSGLLARVCLRAAAMAPAPLPLPGPTADTPIAEPIGAPFTRDADDDYSGRRPPRTSIPERSSTSSM